MNTNSPKETCVPAINRHASTAFRAFSSKVVQPAVTRSHRSTETRVKTLGTMAAAIFLLTMLASPTLGAGWFWDIGNALGFCAFVGLLYISYASANKVDVKAHRLLGIAVLLIAALHVFWLLLGRSSGSRIHQAGRTSPYVGRHLGVCFAERTDPAWLTGVPAANSYRP